MSSPVGASDGLMKEQDGAVLETESVRVIAVISIVFRRYSRERPPAEEAPPAAPHAAANSVYALGFALLLACTPVGGPTCAFDKVKP